MTATDAQHQDRTGPEQRRSRPSGEGVPNWYRQIADGSRPAEVIGSVLMAPEAARVQRNDLEARRRQREEARRERRVRRRRIARSAAGWLVAATFLGGAVLELEAIRLGGPPMLWRGSLPLAVLAFALFRQWRNSASDCRRAEASGIAAFASAAYWAHTSGLPIMPLNVLGGDWSDPLIPLMMSQTALKLAGLLAIAWSLLSFLHRRSDGPPSADKVQRLRAADRGTLRRTAWLTLTGVVPAIVGAILMVTSLGDDLGVIEFGRLFIVSGLQMAVTIVMRGLWLPLLVSGLSLLVRGRWACRPAGTIWAVALLLAGVIALPAGQSAVHQLIGAT